MKPHKRQKIENRAEGTSETLALAQGEIKFLNIYVYLNTYYS